jgi:hypothetical protein
VRTGTNHLPEASDVLIHMANVGPFVCAGLVVALSLAACGDPDEPLDPGPKGCDAATTAEDGATVEGDTRTSEHLTEGSCVTGTARESRSGS